MSIIEKIRARRERPRVRSEPVSNASVRSEPVGDVRGVARSRADVTMTGSEAIYAAVSRISNTIAQLPLHLYKGYEVQTDHPLERLIAYAPNDSMTPYQY